MPVAGRTRPVHRLAAGGARVHAGRVLAVLLRPPARRAERGVARAGRGTDSARHQQGEDRRVGRLRGQRRRWVGRGHVERKGRSPDGARVLAADLDDRQLDVGDRAAHGQRDGPAAGAARDERGPLAARSVVVGAVAPDGADHGRGLTRTGDARYRLIPVPAAHHHAQAASRHRASH